MMNLLPYHGTTWLCEPSRLQQITASVASFPTCRTAKEVAKARQREMSRVSVEALAYGVEGNGRDEAVEAALAAMNRDGARPVPVAKTLTNEERERFKAEWQHLMLHSPAAADVVRFPDDANTLIAKSEVPRAIRAVKGKVGVIPIHGPVDQRQSSALDKAGGTSLEFVSAAFDMLMSSPGIGAVVLHMDSPGGGTYGTQELADKIYSVRAEKPVYCMVDSMACSAGYWIGSAASMMICTPGGDVGSVGVYAMHVDQSGAMEKEGVKVTMVSAGKYKTELAPTGPLSDEARAAVQESVDATYGKFLSALSRNRGTPIQNVRDNYGQGRVVNADTALQRGMIDRVMTFQELMMKLTGGGAPVSQSQRADVSVQVLRMRWRAAQCGVIGEKKKQRHR